MAHPTPAQREHRAVTRAALFVVGVVVVGTVVLTVLGNRHRLFERHVTYFAYFPNVEGLRVDSPVRLGGLDVGTVDDISFAVSDQGTQVRVTINVAQGFTDRIRADSVARIASRGLLGDKTVDITIGSMTSPPLAPLGTLPPGSSDDIASVLKASSQVVDNVVSISNDLRRAIAGFTDPRLQASVKNIVTHAEEVMHEIAEGDGALHAVIYDGDTTFEMKRMMVSASGTLQRLNAAADKADRLLNDVMNGDGTAHAAIYGPEGKNALRELAGAAAAVSNTLKDIKRANGSAANQLLYGQTGREMMSDLAASAAHLKQITAKVDQGDGSLGALVNDPTVYEDLKTVLGNVKRNALLRALVRFTISNKHAYENTGKPLNAAELSPDRLKEASP
ncbi:MAG: MlaD family protein [Myxococcaceae bacterium]|nr:MlaD family protein [Myxococcaceae bacterium]